jgi:hypothetical protein
MDPRFRGDKEVFMKRIVCLAVVAWALLVIPGFSADLDFLVGHQAFPETIGTPRDPGARAAEMRSLQERLAARPRRRRAARS